MSSVASNHHRFLQTEIILAAAKKGYMRSYPIIEPVSDGWRFGRRTYALWPNAVSAMARKYVDLEREVERLQKEKDSLEQDIERLEAELKKRPPAASVKEVELRDGVTMHVEGDE